MRRHATGLLLAWLLLLAAGQAAAFVAFWRFFVHTELGQTLDTIALTGNSIGQSRVNGPASTVLSLVSVASVTVATGFIGFIALILGRVLLAMVAIMLIGGANLTTQIFKYGTGRPDLGVDPIDAYTSNSLPSGHATVAASVAVALVLVLPAALRGFGAVLGAGYATVVGVATLSAGWHRPSDAVAAMLVVGGWAAVAAVVLVVGRREHDEVRPRDAHPTSLALLVVGGLALLTLAAGGLPLTEEVSGVPLEALSRRRLFVAYASSAAGIAGSACLVMALVLATAHRAVPHRVRTVFSAVPHDP